MILFQAGYVYITSNAHKALGEKDNNKAIYKCIERHQRGDFGLASVDKKAVNMQAIKSKDRILSVYQLNKVAFWIITDEKHETTTVLLPSDC